MGSRVTIGLRCLADGAGGYLLAYRLIPGLSTPGTNSYVVTCLAHAGTASVCGAEHHVVRRTVAAAGAIRGSHPSLPAQQQELPAASITTF